MGTRHEQSAEELMNQKKERIRVLNKRRRTRLLPASIILGAMLVATIVLNTNNKEIKTPAQGQMGNLTQIEAAELAKDYVLDYYSVETILNLQDYIMEDYQGLIDYIRNNFKLTYGKILTPSLDEMDRLNAAISGMNDVERSINEKTVGYSKATESERVVKANALYHIRISVLEKQLEEAVIKQKLLKEGSYEYNKNAEEMKDIGLIISDARKAIAMLLEREMTLSNANKGR